MMLNQQLVDKAREAGYNVSAIGLYEKRDANQVFTHPRYGKYVMRNRALKCMTHKQAEELLK